MELFLLRHGQSEANAGLTEHLDSALTPLGTRQAKLAGERMVREGITRVYVSPLRRTLQTAGFVCAATGLTAEITADACEFFAAHTPGYRTFQGLSQEQIAWEFPFAHIGTTFPCELSWWPQEPEEDAHIYARAMRVRDALLTQFSRTAERLLIVSHADTVGRLVEAFLRIPPVPDDPPWSDNCAVSRLSCAADPSEPAVLVYQNDTSHLSSALRT